MSLRTYARPEVVRVLEREGCRCEGVEFPGYEVWTTADGEAFTLVLEPFDLYDEMTLRAVFEFTLRRPLPPELA